MESEAGGEDNTGQPHAQHGGAPWPDLPPLALLLALNAVLLTPPRRSSADCLQFSPIPLPNVVWGLKDSVSACPGGDTLVFAGGSIHPARLRIGVHYEDAFCNVRAGVPPESIWVTYTTASGNLAVNDAGVKVFADDSTDAGGNARITIPSFSGAGRLQVRLYVSGASQGTNLASVRTTHTAGGPSRRSPGTAPQDYSIAHERPPRPSREQHRRRSRRVQARRGPHPVA